jgi:hypothetical protein
LIKIPTTHFQNIDADDGEFWWSSRLTHSTGSNRLTSQSNAVMKGRGTSDMLTEKTLSDSALPWRWIEAGLNVVGKCWTNGCEACGKRAYMKVGFGSINLTELVVLCPMCHRRMTAEIQPKFCQCYYRLSGLDENGEYFSTEWFKAGGKLQEFRDDGSAGEVARMIVVDCRRLIDPPEIAKREAEVEGKDQPVEIGSTDGWGIDSGYSGYSGSSVMTQYERPGGAVVSGSSWGRTSVSSPASVWGGDCVPTQNTQMDAGWGRPTQDLSQECQCECQGIQIQIQRREDGRCSEGIQDQAEGE